MINRFFTAIALTGFALTGASAAADLAPGSGHSVNLGAFDGVVYYTVEEDGYRVVATLASGSDAPPIRVISTLAPGQRIVISVPGSVARPSHDFEIVRNGDALVVDDFIPATAVELEAETPTPASLERVEDR